MTYRPGLLSQETALRPVSEINYLAASLAATFLPLDYTTRHSHSLKG